MHVGFIFLSLDLLACDLDAGSPDGVATILSSSVVEVAVIFRIVFGPI
jgi:hypothetical protein